MLDFRLPAVRMLLAYYYYSSLSLNKVIMIKDIKVLLTPLQKKYPVDFDDELKIGDVRYDNMT